VPFSSLIWPPFSNFLLKLLLPWSCTRSSSNEKAGSHSRFWRWEDQASEEYPIGSWTWSRIGEGSLERCTFGNECGGLPCIVATWSWLHADITRHVQLWCWKCCATAGLSSLSDLRRPTSLDTCRTRANTVVPNYDNVPSDINFSYVIAS